MTTPTWVHLDDGTDLAAYDFGGDGPAVLFAHATGFHAHTWLPVVGHLRDAFHCYAFDVRGHGASPTPPSGDFDWRHMGLDSIAVARALGLRAPFGVGHSAGGAQLVLAEEDHPGAWAALWTYEPVIRTGLPATGENPLAAGARRRRDRFPSRDDAYENFASKPPFDVFAPEALRAYVDFGFVDDLAGGVVLACRGEDEAATYEGALRHGAYDRLDTVHIRVTVVGGGSEAAHFDAGILAEVVDRLPEGKLEIIDGLGHFGPLEDPARIAASIRASLG